MFITEDKESDIAKKMTNAIAVKNGNEESRKVQVYIRAIKQESIKELLNINSVNHTIWSK